MKIETEPQDWTCRKDVHALLDQFDPDSRVGTVEDHLCREITRLIERALAAKKDSAT